MALELEREAPFLAPAEPLATLGHGFYSRVFQTASGWIVRVARVREAAERHAREAVLLPRLSPALPVAVPQPVRILGPHQSAPFGAFAYRPLPGRIMAREDAEGEGWEAYARGLAEALAALHRFPFAEAEALGVPAFDFESFLELRQVVSEPLRERLATGEWARVESWWETFISDTSLHDWHPALTHGDIWWGNLTVEGGRLAGMLDWEFASIADPAWDLGSSRQMGEPFAEAAWNDYHTLAPLDTAARHRAGQWWALRVFFGVRFAIDRHDEGEWADSLQKLREGPILA